MTIKIDPRSLVVGAAVAVVVLMSMGVGGSDQDAPQSERFQVESSEVYTVILDTATGQAWRYHLSTSRETELCPAKLKPAGD